MAREILNAKLLDSLLKQAIVDAATKKTRVRISDGDNLNLIVRANGAASWVLDYRFAGKRKPLTLGPWPAVTLKIARELADSNRASVAKGIDPLVQKAAVKLEIDQVKAAQQAQTDTVLKLEDEWLKKLGSTLGYKDNIRAAFTKDVMIKIGAKVPHEVTARDCLEILREIEKRGAHNMVRRVRMWMRQMFDFGVDHEDRPLLVNNPVPMGTLRSFARHDAGNYAAVTDAGEVRLLMRAIRGHSKTIARSYLVFQAYVFQRPSESREATWSEFDLDAAKWVIPSERLGRKGGDEHWVPLAPQVVAFLRQYQGVVGVEGLLFPGMRRGQAISEGTAQQALYGLGYKGRHTPHGFRAMARTIGEEVLRIDAKLLEKQLGHEYDPSGLRGAYNRAEYWDERVTMMKTWADWLDAQV
ncbi:integrase arm-type DNA-binding domain-containing protein [Paucibacter sp. DJ1R-11]|uniref:tyrosine-type recombinase/integrase n=1 Tax=Paucibacter sp. DJ1R-11 TaxID=2893556 RepID=UPI0021E45C2D|nr:integrase arm-type DNA-binding domain-containing protein [Paucibacter sp. DJ1R-11]MCV2363546.1 integrase arm-type DNA-binding domain-containing protein [Paucibacter sp. DJ1R-11]